MLSDNFRFFLSNISIPQLFQAFNKDDRKIILESIKEIEHNLNMDDAKVIKDFVVSLNENKYSSMIGKIIKFNHQIIDNMIKSASEKFDVKFMTSDDKALMKALLRTSLFYSENAELFIKKIDNEVK